MKAGPPLMLRLDPSTAGAPVDAKLAAGAQCLLPLVANRNRRDDRREALRQDVEALLPPLSELSNGTLLVS